MSLDRHFFAGVATQVYPMA